MITKEALFAEGLGGGRDKLISATSLGDIEHVRYMLERGTSPNVKDFDGDTSLSAAAELGRTMILELLLEHGGNPNNLSYIGWTPLMLAVCNDHAACAFELLRRGARVTCVEDVKQYTPLHMAARWGHTRVAKLLIDAGAVVGTPDARGYSARDVAERYNHRETAGAIDRLAASRDADDAAAAAAGGPPPPAPGTGTRALDAAYVWELLPELAHAPLEEQARRCALCFSFIRFPYQATMALYARS